MNPVVRRRLVSLGANAFLVLVILAFLGPMLWLFTAAFNPTAQLNFEVPTDPSFDNFRSVATVDQLYRPLLNSTILALIASTVTVVAACFCAYPLSRYRLRFGRFFMYLILVNAGLPIVALMIPTFRLFSRFDLTNNTPVTALFMSAITLPFAIWLAKNSIDGVPFELEEAARMDGATTWQTITRVVIPLIRPGVTVIFIFAFISHWGNFFVPLILFNEPSKQTASVAIYNYFNTLGGVYFGRVGAFAILYSLPPVVLFIIITRSVGNTFSFAGSVKG